jgi:hypothetical protein
VPKWLVTQKEFQQGRAKLVLQYDVSDAARTTWKSSGIPVQLNLNCSYYGGGGGQTKLNMYTVDLFSN